MLAKLTAAVRRVLLNPRLGTRVLGMDFCLEIAGYGRPTTDADRGRTFTWAT
jgi:hypothetical protein